MRYSRCESLRSPKKKRRWPAATDDRTRRLIERTDSLGREQLAGLHGAVRAMEPVDDAIAAGEVRSKGEREKGEKWRRSETCPTAYD